NAQRAYGDGLVAQGLDLSAGSAAPANSQQLVDTPRAGRAFGSRPAESADRADQACPAATSTRLVRRTLPSSEAYVRAASVTACHTCCCTSDGWDVTRLVIGGTSSRTLRVNSSAESYSNVISSSSTST